MPLYLFLYRVIPINAKITNIWQFIMLTRIFKTIWAHCHFSEACRSYALQALFVKLSLFKLSTTFQDFIYVGSTAFYIICSQVSINVLISMKVSESHLYHIWDYISCEIHVYLEWTQESLILYVCFNISL
jgi:hypothetical protein